MRFYLTAFILIVTFKTTAQFSDDFTDGDFTDSPEWVGMTDNFEVNAEQQLHLLAPAETDTSYLVVASTAVDDVTWDFWLKMDFNPSSGNNARVYLVSDQEDLKNSLNGYFVMVGNTPDEISLYRQDGTSITKIIDGEDGTVDASEVIVRIQVTRDAAGNWELFRDATGGYTYISEGTVFDNTYTASSYFGVFCKYTSTRSELFYFDDLGTPYADAVAPEVTAVNVVSSTELSVLFSEPLAAASAETETNYNVDLGIGTPISAVVDGGSPEQVNLTFSDPFVNGESYELSVENVEDLSGNPIELVNVPFLYFIPEEAVYNEVIFTEVLADPNPVVGLPEVEFVEIYNRSDKIFDLENWTFSDNSTTAVLESHVLAPGEYVVLCAPGEGALFATGNVLETEGLPTLTNSDDDLVLKTNTSVLIDSVHYFVSWYNDSDKDDGGWTLERKHLNAPCSDGTNWGASVDPSGGTPGFINSINTDEDDAESPFVTDFELVDEEELTLYFNESMNQDAGLELSLSPEIASISGSFVNPLTYTATLNTLASNTVYTLTISEGADCWGNPINETIKFGIPENPEPEDIILNEILFDPQSGGTDYVELYNRSEKIVDIHTLAIASWDDNGDTLDNFLTIGEEQFLLLPGEYALLTEDSLAVIEFFPTYGVGRFVETDLPSMPNDSGSIFLYWNESVRLDYFQYEDDDQFALLNTEDGKALERITFEGGMNNPNNWHTASEAVSWGTPGYQNSQFIMPNATGEVSVDPKLFSPDNDGFQDLLTITIELNSTDNVADVEIYDHLGRKVKQLADNYFVGQSSTLVWDGITDEGTKAPIGTYIVLVTTRNAAGDTGQFKVVAVLAGKL